MKKIFYLLLVAIMTANVMAQEPVQFSAVNHNTDTIVRYKLYPTANMWNFLKLDTQTGAIYQVQYSIKDAAGEFATYLGAPLTLPKRLVNGRFELYPTQNTWTFILVDQIDGYTYHVQWGFEKEQRYVIRIP